MEKITKCSDLREGDSCYHNTLHDNSCSVSKNSKVAHFVMEISTFENYNIRCIIDTKTVQDGIMANVELNHKEAHSIG